jgi:pimeloyl-ACP methyl ester carboxylesterase
MHTSAVHHARVSTNGIQLNVAMAGPEDGPLVILLHGFPEFWYGWKQQIPHLAAAGLRVWVPDQRGYGASDKPGRVEDYNLDALAADVLGLIDAAGAERACLVGHDWGGEVSWWTAMRHPERVERIVVMNAPHPEVMRSTLRRSPSQWIRSAYMLLFMVPRVPEALAGAGHWRALREAMQRTSRPGTFSPEDLERYREAWSAPGAFTAMLNWYRALPRGPAAQGMQSMVRCPALIIWGVEDAFLRVNMARESLAWCEHGRLELLEAGHWVQHEEAARINVLLEQWLREPEGSMAAPSDARGAPR